MSKSDSPDEEESAPDSASTVGYKNPPAEHRFKKGVSGNPRGRPRKPKQRGTTFRSPLSDLIIAEAYRPITFRENDKPVTLPMIQAVARSLGVAAVKGNHRAQIAITNLVSAIDRKEIDDTSAMFQAFLEYKKNWDEEFKRCDEAGEPRPDPVPHPDDVVLNARTGEVIFNGPFDDFEKAKWDHFKKLKADAVEEMACLKDEMKRETGPTHFYQDDLEHDQRVIDLVDRTFPDEETRRRPDFVLSEWRNRQTELQELRRKWRRPASKGGPSGVPE